jgi:hypothetical protein
MDEDVVLSQAPAAADINLPLRESAPVNAPDPREMDGGVEPDRGTRTSAMAGAGTTPPGNASSPGDFSTGATAADRQPIALVREGMTVVDSAGNEVGKVEFVKMGDPEAATVSPADATDDRGGLFEGVAEALSGPDADDLPVTLAGEMLRVGYLRVDTKGWFNKDRFVPADAITGVTGDRVGQARRAIPAESSFTSVPLTLDAILGADHVVNVHLSAEEIGTYIACGEIGGSMTPEGAVIIGLRELNDSGFTGIAYLAPGADGASTDVSAFVAPTLDEGRNRGGGGDDETATADATPADEGMGGMDMGTPEADS